MATWQGYCWLGSENGYQTLEVQSNTYHGAEAQLKRIYGAETVANLHEVSGGSSHSGGGGFSLPGWNTFKYLVAGFFLLMVLTNVGQNEEMSNPTPAADTVEMKSFLNGNQ